MVIEMGQRFMFLTLGLVSLLALGACGSDGGGGGGTPPPATAQTGTVSGTVVSALTAAPVSGAKVSVGALTATSQPNGTFSITLEVGDRVVIHTEAAGFAEAFHVARISAGQSTSLGVRLLPTGATSLVTVATGGVVTVPNSPAQVSIPAAGLVPQAGGQAAPTVNVAVTPINPAVDISVMPGDFTAVSAGGGATNTIESFGAMLVDIRDNAGIRYTLAPGQQSTIRIPLGTRSAVRPNAIPLFFFNETTGLWVEEGTATIAGIAPNQYYEGTVTRFSYWNADRVMETVFVSGCVRDAANQPVANALVQTDGIDYSGAASARSAADGSFRVALRRASHATLISLEGTRLSSTSSIGPFAADFTLPSCLVLSSVTNGLSIKLTWGAQPLDLDSHLYTPNGTHVYFGTKGTLASLPFASLDVDDVTSFGPEVVTIVRPMQGTYQYLVHNFSGTFAPGITGSPARVELTRNGVPTLFVPPVGEGANRYWHVFDVVVDAQCQVTIVPVNTWLTSPAPLVPIAAAVCPAS